MDPADGDSSAPPLATRQRNQVEAWRVAGHAYPFGCCVICGLQVETCLHVTHLDHDAANHAADNLAHLCGTHRWMYDAGLYPPDVIRKLRSHWQAQVALGRPDRTVRMKEAGRKGRLIRKPLAAAREAVAGWRPTWLEAVSQADPHSLAGPSRSLPHPSGAAPDRLWAWEMAVRLSPW